MFSGNDGRGKEETRARILLAARDCFARIGFDRTTVKMIARACGLTDAAIYYYFPSKRHLLDAVWSVRTSRTEGGAADSQRPMSERLRAINDSTLDFIADNHQLLRIMFQEALGGDETARAMRNDWRAGWRRSLQDLFNATITHGSSDDATESILAVVTGMVMRAQIEEGDNVAAIVRSPEFRQRVHDGCLFLLEPHVAPAPGGR